MRVAVHAEPATLTVADTGPGLVEEDVLRAFERFYLYERSGGESRAVGTGLGLAFAKRIGVRLAVFVGYGTRDGVGVLFKQLLELEHRPDAL